MAEELNAVLTLRASSREAATAGLAAIESMGYGSRLLDVLDPMPAEWVAADGSFSGDAVTWAFDHWGCKGFALAPDPWWEETAPGDDDNEWRVCWDLMTVSGVPLPILTSLSKMLSDVAVGYYLVGLKGDYEVILLNGETDYEDGEPS